MLELKLRDYQKEGVEFLVSKRRAYLADDAGLGKTVTILETVNRLDGYPLLVIAPKMALYTWRKELDKWYGLPSIVYTGKPYERKELWADFVYGGFPMLVTNYALVSEILEKTLATERKWGTVVADEIHLGGLLNKDTQTFKKVKALCRTSQNFFPITATPIRRNPADLWAPLHLINPDRFASYWRFVYTYCMVIEDTFGKSIEPLPKNPMQLKQLLNWYMIRRLKKDVLPELPPTTRQPMIVEMTPKQAKTYKKLSEEAIVATKSSIIVTPNEVTKILRLRQLLVTPQILGIDDIGGALEVLPELIMEEFDRGKPVVIFTPFVSAIDFIVERLVDTIENLSDVYVIKGKMGASEIFRESQKFQNNPDPRRVLICSIKSSASYDAYAASACFFLGCEWSSIDNEQAEARLHRLGQEDKVHAYYITHLGTVDELVMQRLDDKARASNWTLRPEEVLRFIAQSKQNVM